MTKHNKKVSQEVEIYRIIGGGYEMKIDGDFMGTFGTFRAAQEFAAECLRAMNIATSPRRNAGGEECENPDKCIYLAHRGRKCEPR